MKSTFWAGMADCLCLIFVSACEDEQIETLESQVATLRVVVAGENLDTLAYLPGEVIRWPGYAELTHGDMEPSPGTKIQFVLSTETIMIEFQDSLLLDTTNADGRVNFHLRVECGHGPEVIQAAAEGLFAVDTIHLWDCGPGWH
jgi:hypothetical protein